MGRKGDGILLKGRSWYLDCRINGVRHQRWLGRDISRLVALELSMIMRADILRGIFGIAPISERKRNLVSAVRTASRCKIELKQPRRKNRRSQESVFCQREIYFIHNPLDRTIKIGITTNVKMRFSNLQTANSSRLTFLGSFPGNLNSEKLLHEQFAHDRTGGEWFRESDLLHDCIRSLLESAPSLYLEREKIKNQAAVEAVEKLVTMAHQ